VLDIQSESHQITTRIVSAVDKTVKVVEQLKPAQNAEIGPERTKLKSKVKKAKGDGGNHGAP
jgi:hypothetical protein